MLAAIYSPRYCCTDHIQPFTSLCLPLAGLTTWKYPYLENVADNWRQVLQRDADALAMHALQSRRTDRKLLGLVCAPAADCCLPIGDMQLPPWRMRQVLPPVLCGTVLCSALQACRLYNSPVQSSTHGPVQTVAGARNLPSNANTTGTCKPKPRPQQKFPSPNTTHLQKLDDAGVLGERELPEAIARVPQAARDPAGASGRAGRQRRGRAKSMPSARMRQHAAAPLEGGCSILLCQHSPTLHRCPALHTLLGSPLHKALNQQVSHLFNASATTSR